MRKFHLGAFRAPLLILLLYPAQAGAQTAAGDLVRGQVIEKVACAHDAAQSYALYLPSNYSPDRKWPILYALDAGARGSLAVRRFKDAAEQYGYILAGSNNSRNGPLKVVEDAVNALVKDTEGRFSLDFRRVYLAGFSGGARVAILFGFALKERVAGIVACGAGFPPAIQPSASIPFALYVTVGDEDFYFPELRALDRTLDGFHVAHQLETFRGGHEWPSETICTRAVEWFELQAMKSGNREKDDSLIDSIYAKTVAAAASYEKEQQLFAALESYEAARSVFAGLRDVAALATKAKQLEQTPDVRKSLAREKDVEARQRNTDAELSGLLGDLIGDRDRPFAMQKLSSSFSSVRNDANQRKNEVDRLVALRVLTRFWILLNEETSLAFERHDYGPAALRLQVMTQIRPDNPQAYFHLARAYCRSGRKKEAIAALRDAVARGYKDIAALESNPDLESLRQEPAFRKIVEDLAKRR
jgi:dienelactone hydrolase